MKIERLKKSHKKEIIIGGMIILGIISAITITTSRAKYRLTQSVPIVRGTINYKPYDLKIMAMYKQKEGSTCTEDSCYDEITGEMPSSGYAVNEDKTYCLTSNNEQVKGKIKTVNGTVTLTNLIKNDKCYIWFDKAPSAENTLAKLNITNYSTTTPDFTAVATTDEGVFRVSDGMYGGYSYYWRGAVENNHVIFANMCWRIIRINGDGTIRLIYNGAKLTGDTCTGNGVNNTGVLEISAYNNTSSDSFLASAGWTYKGNWIKPYVIADGIENDSTAKSKVDSWLKNYVIKDDLEKVANGKFCNDRVVGKGILNNSSSPFYYISSRRLDISSPTLSCSEEDVYEVKVGLISVDEVMYAGGKKGVKNTLYYLYCGKKFWTMSPNQAMSTSGASMSVVEFDGSLISTISNKGDTTYLRPVINLSSDVTFNSGSDGTPTKPYIVQV